ncbi:hypothetical protein AB1471_10220 [Jeotgalibacillus marinus]|uniref:Uncharacterized protein n=1 Tax=Jeotgalibacillus marinus TaxID=86667 RepID=A0ABV3Q4A0_9BACL
MNDVLDQSDIILTQQQKNPWRHENRLLRLMRKEGRFLVEVVWWKVGIRLLAVFAATIPVNL